MSKKKPRSKDPHSWIKDTTKQSKAPGKASQAAKSEPAEKLAAQEETDETSAEQEAQTATLEATPQRTIIVEYDKNDGSILATHEVFQEAYADAGQAPASASEGRAAARIILTGKLLDKRLLDIHENYKVVITKKKPTLIPKG
jgi:hypothetical protein